jgi:hypothetical protein
MKQQTVMQIKDSMEKLNLDQCVNVQLLLFNNAYPVRLHTSEL